MRVLVALVAVAVFAALIFAIRRRARAIASAAARVAADRPPPVSSFPSVASSRGRHLGTAVLPGRFDPLLPGFERDVDGVLEISDRELLLRAGDAVRFHVPASHVVEAALVGAFEGKAAGQPGALLRIVWERGGERLQSVFALARRDEAEKLRREIHLRAGRAEYRAVPPPPA